MAGKQGKNVKNVGKVEMQPYKKFSNEEASQEIVRKMCFLKIHPEDSSYEKIVIKDKDHKPVQNKNGEILYFYNVLFKIPIKDGVFHNIKFAQCSNALLPSSKNFNVFNVQLYLVKEKKDYVRQTLFSTKNEFTILNTVTSYSEFTKSDDVHAIISFNIKNADARKAYDDVHAIIHKINEILVKSQEKPVSASLATSATSANFPTLCKDAKSFKSATEVKATVVPEVKATVVPEVKATVVPEVKAPVATEVKGKLTDILKNIEDGREQITKLSKEELELEILISAFEDELKKFEIEMKKKLEDGIKELKNNNEDNVKKLKEIKGNKKSEISKVELNSKIMIEAISAPSTSWADVE